MDNLFSCCHVPFQDDSRPSMISCVPSNKSGSPRSSYTFIEYTRESVVVPRPTMTAVSMVDNRSMVDKNPKHSEQYRSAAPASTVERYFDSFVYIRDFSLFTEG